MIGLWLLFEIGINIYQGILMVYFINRVTVARKHSFFIDGATVFFITLFLSLYLFFDMPFIDTFVFVLPLIHAFIVSPEKWFLKIFWGIALAALFIGTITLVSNACIQILNVSWDIIIGENQFRIVYVLICNLCLLLVLFIVSKLCSHHTIISWKTFSVFIIQLILQLASIEALFALGIHEKLRNHTFIIVCLGIFCTALISIILFEMLTVSAQKQKEAERKLQTFQSLQEHNIEIKNMYASILQYQHDFKHKLQIIERTIQSKGALASYGFKFIEKAKLDIEDVSMLVTGNIALDAVLAAKKATMNNNNISFCYSAYPFSELPIDEISLSILLANLLDNAIEAVQRLPNDYTQRTIILTFSRSRDMMNIICKNDYLPDSIRKKGEIFISSKESPSLHGFGIKNITSLCQQADGVCSFTCEQRFFVVSIMLPYKRQEK